METRVTTVEERVTKAVGSMGTGEPTREEERVTKAGEPTGEEEKVIGREEPIREKERVTEAMGSMGQESQERKRR